MTTTQKTTDVTAPRRSHWWWTVPGCLAMVLLNAAVSYGIVRLNAPVTAAFNMKQTVDAFFDSASQKQLSEAQSKALSARFNTALEASLQAWQQKHHAVILVVTLVRLYLKVTFTCVFMAVFLNYLFSDEFMPVNSRK